MLDYSEVSSKENKREESMVQQESIQSYSLFTILTLSSVLYQYHWIILINIILLYAAILSFRLFLFIIGFFRLFLPHYRCTKFPSQLNRIENDWWNRPICQIFGCVCQWCQWCQWCQCQEEASMMMGSIGRVGNWKIEVRDDIAPNFWNVGTRILLMDFLNSFWLDF